MTTLFPGAADVFTAIPAGTHQVEVIGGRTHRASHNDLGDAIEAVEAKVGTGASTPVANTLLGGTGAGTSSFRQVQTADIAVNAVTIRSASVAGSTNPATTNTTIAALANPTISITTTAVSDIYVWATGEISDSVGGTQVDYFVRIDGGAWQGMGQTFAPAGGRFTLAGVHVFMTTGVGAHTIEMGNTSNNAASTITHWAGGRKLAALAIAK